jgi:hypothetical protein
LNSQQEVVEEWQLTVKHHMGPRTSTNAVVCVCKTWSVVLWEEHGLTLFENRAWRKINVGLNWWK